MITIIIFSLVFAAIFIMHMVFSFLFCSRENKDNTIIDCIPNVSIIMPSFNEQPEHINETINSVLQQQKINFELIIIDDGSTIPLQVPNDPRIKLIRLDTNKGKRNAQMIGMEQSKYEWIATVDSDTILDNMAIFYLHQATLKQNVQAVTGTVFVKNKNENVLAKITSCMYGLSIFQQRGEQALFGCVTCCSGALSLYKKNVILENKEDYLNQNIWGIKCIAGDDRHLSSIFLLNNNKVGWTSKAKCYTVIPSSMKKIIKQQLRWTRSNVAEFNNLLTKIDKWTPTFAFFTNKLIYIYLYKIFAYIMLIYFTITTLSIVPFIVVLISLFVTTAIKWLVEYFGNYTSKNETSGIFYLIMYVLFEFFIITPVRAFGIITPHKTGWLTRKSS